MLWWSIRILPSKVYHNVKQSPWLLNISHIVRCETRWENESQVTTTSAEIEIEDINDNYPAFTSQDSEYLRVVQEGDTSFRPPLVIQVLYNVHLYHVVPLTQGGHPSVGPLICVVLYSYS